MSTPAKPKIHLQLAAAIQAIVAIGKEKRNEDQKFNFRGIDDIYNNLHPIFSKCGLICLPLIEEATVETQEYTKEYMNKKETKRLYVAKVVATYRFMADDGSYVDAKGTGVGHDYSDKALNKAQSAAHKYVLTQMFLLPFKDLDDGDIETTSLPHEELQRIREQEAREQVQGNSDNGEQVQIPEKVSRKLDAKRKEANQQQEPTTVEETTKPEIPPKKEATPVGEHIIQFIPKEGIKGVAVSQMSDKDLNWIKVKWIEIYAEKIAKDADKSKERDAVLAEIEKRAKAK